MTIRLQNHDFEIKNFLFNRVKIQEDLPSTFFASKFLTTWISGSKEFMVHTSGTTGNPKQITLKRKWMEVSALQTINRLSLWDERILCCIPCSKIGGMMLLVRALAGGFDIDIHEPSLNPLISISRDHRYTLISLIPAQMYTILKDEESLLKLNKFKNILLGGAHISDELATMLGKVKPKVYHTYGMTETCSLIALRLMNHDPWPGFRMNDYISSELSEECCLSVKGEQTGNQWVHTRDVIEFLSDGSFLIKGRLDTSINTGGHKIFPEILEPRILEILKQNSIEVNLAITSIPDPIWGEQLVLVTEPLNGIENPLEILNNKLKPFELPRAFLIIEKLPLNQSLKTDRAELKNLVLMEKNLKLL